MTPPCPTPTPAIALVLILAAVVAIGWARDYDRCAADASLVFCQE